MNAYLILGAVLMCGQILTCFFIVAALPKLISGSAWRPAFFGIMLTMATAIWIMKGIS